jgi:hypothetical protein
MGTMSGAFNLSGHCGEPVRLVWVDEQGRAKSLVGKCIDITDQRVVHVEVVERIPLRTQVRLRGPNIELPPLAFVNSVTACATKFILVLE